MTYAYPWAFPRWQSCVCRIVVTLILICTGPCTVRAADVAESSLWKFLADENWQVGRLDDPQPRPYRLTSDEQGALLSFDASQTDTTCSLWALRWKVRDPIGVAPTKIVLNAADGADVKLGMVLIDDLGSMFELPPRAIQNGTVSWDIASDAKLIKKAALPATRFAVNWDERGEAKRTVGIFADRLDASEGKPVGPIYLEEIRVIKSAGLAGAVRITGAHITDPGAGTMAMATEKYWYFDRPEAWRDVHQNDKSLYVMSWQPDGLAFTFKPWPKGITLKLPAPPFLEECSMGRSTRIVTHVEQVSGEDKNVCVALGCVDREREPLGGDATWLVNGLNDSVWDATQVTSGYRGKRNGQVDFPIRMDDFTITRKGSAVETKIIFHSATRDILRPVVYQTHLDAGRPRFLWQLGEPLGLNLAIVNIGAAAYAGELHASLRDDLDHELVHFSVPISVPEKSSGNALLRIDTHKLPQGVYILRWQSADGSDALKGMALLTLAGDGPIRKAKEGEFVYGIDGVGWEQTRLLDWTDWCGIDMIRNAGRDQNFRSEDITGDIESALQTMAQRGLRTNLMLSPRLPWSKDPDAFGKIIAQQADFCQRLAEHCKGRVTWYEIGNEPSLTFFFNGPIPDYVKLYNAMADAIKAGDPAAKVSNGGLAWAGMAGAQQRAAQIIQQLPSDKVDAWAYHGHGEGAAAERFFFEETKRVIVAAKKDGKPILETESGTTSIDPPSWRAQAITLVQKLVYAQSTQEIPFFLYFGFHPGWEWGILQSEAEAKPAALAYRVLVQQTRGMKCQPRLDLQGADGEGYWFDALPSADARVLMVLWSNGGEFTRSIKFPAGAKEATELGMFGNESPLLLDSDGVAQVNVTVNPIYISVKGVRGAAPVVLPRTLDLPTVLNVVPGSSVNVNALVRNVAAKPMDAALNVLAGDGMPISGGSTAVHIDGHGKADAVVTLHAAEQSKTWWPRAWTVFKSVTAPVDLATFTSVPETIMDNGNAIPSVTGICKGTDLDIGALGTPGHAEKRQAICFAAVAVDADMDAQIGAAADFWMEWYVNGKPVFDTLASGNGGGYDVLAHVFTIHLHKGENLLAVRVLSGSLGWRLVTGGPETVAAAQRIRAGEPAVLKVELREGDRIAARESLRYRILPAIDDRQSGKSWDQCAPDGVLGYVNNQFSKQPDASRWYHGPNDLSGKVYIRSQMDGSLVIAVAVRDDIDKPGDGVTIKIASGAGWKQRVEISSSETSVTRKRDETSSTTWYEAVISKPVLALIPRAMIAINVVVRDDDWGVLKQTATMMPGDDPQNWYLCWQR